MGLFQKISAVFGGGESAPASPAPKPAKPVDEAALAARAAKLSLKDIDNITDQALLRAYVQQTKSKSLAYPALQKITSDDELARVAEDDRVDRRLRIYAVHQIKSDDVKLALFRKYRNGWIGQEARSQIRSQQVRYQLFLDFPGSFSPAAFTDPAILRDILENHRYADDSMDPFGTDRHSKADLYNRVLETGNRELIDLLDRDACRAFAQACIQNADTHWAKFALQYLKRIYRAGVCPELAAEIEAMNGKTFHHIDEVNYYGEREYVPGVVFDLYGPDDK
ncbi:MAG: hypothetical protein IJH91_00050 [Mogibacterium sp.]|nr:hypothetical protein [Mogibacterium sp.]